MQATVDGKLLDNGSWRRIVGEFVYNVAAVGAESLSVDFVIEGDTPEELQTRLASTMADFVTRNKSCSATLDVLAANKYVNFDITSGNVIATITEVLSNPSMAKTAYSLPFTLHLEAEHTRQNMALADGLESLTLMESHNAARIKARVLTGFFVAGAGDSAAVRYAAARAMLLTSYLLTAASGARSPVTKFVLIEEQTNDTAGESRRIDFTLESEYQEFEFKNLGAPTRQVAMTISSERVPWSQDVDAGPQPTLIRAEGGVFLDRTLYTDGLTKKAEAIELDVIAAIIAETGKTDLQILARNFSADPDSGVINFLLTFHSDNNAHIQFERRIHIEDAEDRAAIVDSLGFSYVQKSPGSPSRMQTVTINRVGSAAIGPTLLKRPIPATIPGRVCNYINSTYDIENVIDDFSFRVRETISITYDEIKLRANNPQPPPEISPVNN